MSLVPALPLSLRELLDYYMVAIRECEFLSKQLQAGLDLLEGRMKPSAAVSVQFNNYEAYYISFLNHLGWRLSPLCVDEALDFGSSSVLEYLKENEYKYSRVGHPIDEAEIVPMMKSLNGVRKRLLELVSNIETSMLKSLFLCHSSDDKPKVRVIAEQLTLKGAQVWLDEAEILVGDSIIEKIQEGIENSDYLGIVLSPKSVASIWVRKEVEAALAQEIESGEVKVIPILLEPCEIPLFLKPKKYADMSSAEKCGRGLSEILQRLGA